MASTALVSTDTPTVTFTPDQIAPASAKQLEEYIDRYQAMAATLDRKMPDQIMTVGGKQFRKKGYWLAIAQGFGLILDLRDEARLTPDENDFGYVVTYRATDPRTGRYCDGDGACYASEKTQARSGIGGTEHNVRAHAHTRATNRAIAKLVGFGEVSADELQDGVEPTTTPQPAAKKSPAEGRGGKAKGGLVISEKQGKRLFAIMKSKGRETEDVQSFIKSQYGYSHSREILRDDYEEIIEWIESDN